jgi:hypothetical protein
MATSQFEMTILWNDAESARCMGNYEEARKLYCQLIEKAAGNLESQENVSDRQAGQERLDSMKLTRAAAIAISALDDPVERQFDSVLSNSTMRWRPQVNVPPPVGFWHVAAINDWRRVVMSQYERLRASKLLDRCERVFVTLLGEEPAAMPIADSKIELAYWSRSLHEFEVPTLARLQSWCRQNTGGVFYIHTKGVSRSHDCPTVVDWRALLERFVIDEHELCYQSLQKWDAVGANWHLRPFPHFSGNFWWARADYIRRLPDIASHPDRSDRLFCERWIGLDSTIQAASLHESHVNHYETPYPISCHRANPSEVCKLEPALVEALPGLSNWNTVVREWLTPILPVSVVVAVGTDLDAPLAMLSQVLPNAKLFGIPCGSTRESVPGSSLPDALQMHFRAQSQENPRIAILSNTNAIESWPFSYQIDLLVLGTQSSYPDLADEFAKWLPLVRPGGGVIFQGTHLHSGSSGRFFEELLGEKRDTRAADGFGIWYKPMTIRSLGGSDPSVPELSVLIPTLTERKEKFDQLRSHLLAQIHQHSLHAKVELLWFEDDRQRSVGAKRNSLVARASGRFVVFIDDDDEVDPEYLPTLVQILEEHYDIDCVGFLGEMTWAGQSPEPTIYSLKYLSPATLGQRPGFRVHLRPPQHLNPIRREIALRFPFPNLNYGEDAVRSQALVEAKVLHREYFYGQRYLYRYLFDPRTTATQALLGSPQSSAIST